jgi:deoxyribodipyrimidine photo-lyase
MPRPTLLWFRQDLRLADNAALTEAVARGGPVLPVYVLDDTAAGPWRAGGAARWWLHHSLAALDRSLQGAGNRLLLLRGAAEVAIPHLALATGARAVLWNRLYEPFHGERDSRIAEHLQGDGIEAARLPGALLAEPSSVKTATGGPYRVFTPFFRALLREAQPAAPLPAPGHIPGLAAPPVGDRLEDWRLPPHAPDWAGGLRAAWSPGEQGARRRLLAFTEDGVARYGERRDLPAEDGTSRLSAALHWGELSPRQVWHAVRPDRPGVAPYLRQLVWREFCHHLLHHFPTLPTEPLDRSFRHFPWTRKPDLIAAWQRGRTGYPIVDAGMRQLWAEGWMHNRVRMIAASFLVKHLLQPWQAGAAWFWDTLVDADLANNSAGWQWVAGCGADAAPYFRIFNPVLQGERFDPHGHYVRRWVPELARLPDRWLHKPWAAPADVLAAAGVVPGALYPRPVIDHTIARERALAAYREMREAAEP